MGVSLGNPERLHRQIKIKGYLNRRSGLHSRNACGAHSEMPRIRAYQDPRLIFPYGISSRAPH